MNLAFVSISSLSKSKLDQLNACTSIPQYYIAVDGWRMDQKEKSVFYTVQIGYLLEDKVMVHQFEAKYSTLRKFNKSLGLSPSDSQGFPGKRFIGSKNIDAVRDRAQKLQVYFGKLSSNHEVQVNENFRSFFKLDQLRSLWAHEFFLIQSSNIVF